MEDLDDLVLLESLAGVSHALGHANTAITAQVYAEALRSTTGFAAVMSRVVEAG